MIATYLASQHHVDLVSAFFPHRRLEDCRVLEQGPWIARLRTCRIELVDGAIIGESSVHRGPVEVARRASHHVPPIHSLSYDSLALVLRPAPSAPEMI